MIRQFKLLAVIVIAMIILAGGIYIVVGNPIILMNNQKLANVLKSSDVSTVRINEVIPFEWDVMYTFDPYTSKESIEEIIGFKSNAIKVNTINEEMVHLLFVKDKQVVASVLGYSEDLGYSLEFSSEVTFDEEAVFNVVVSDGVVIYKNNKDEVLPYGSYVLESSEDESKPTIEIRQNGKFTFMFSLIISYRGYGAYEIKGNQLELITDDKEDVYVFDIADKQLVFNAEHSSTMTRNPEIVDGVIFKLVD